MPSCAATLKPTAPGCMTFFSQGAWGQPSGLRGGAGGGCDLG